MRILTTLVICAAASLAAPVYAQTENERPPASGLQDAPQLRPTAVAIIAMNALPVEVQMQVKAKIAETSKDDMQALRRSIDATPEASSALRAQGLSSAEVVAALVRRRRQADVGHKRRDVSPRRPRASRDGCALAMKQSKGVQDEIVFSRRRTNLG
jgi:uncharacterized membrane protein